MTIFAILDIINIIEVNMSLITKLSEQKKLNYIEHVELDCNFIANKIISETYRTKDNNTLTLTCKRLNKLVLLVNIAYMQKYSKLLVKNDYRLWISGLVVPKIYYCYSRNGVKYDSTLETDLVEGMKQEEVEKTINHELNSEINNLVKQILGMTRYIDTIDLVEILLVKRLNQDYQIDSDIPKKIISKFYKDFNFDKLKELNERSKKEIFNL